MDRRHDEAACQGELFADGLDAGEQFTVLGRIDKGNEAIADLQLDQVDVEHLFVILIRLDAGWGRSTRVSSFCLAFSALSSR